jgi:hypothetical protein
VFLLGLCSLNKSMPCTGAFIKEFLDKESLESFLFLDIVAINIPCTGAFNVVFLIIYHVPYVDKTLEHFY